MFWRFVFLDRGSKVAALRCMGSPKLNFEVWKACLRENCARHDKLLAFNKLGEYCLRILWEGGVDPLVHAIVEDGKSAMAEGRNVA